MGAIASKPVMEGKAVLFKRFADIDSIDIRNRLLQIQKKLLIQCKKYLQKALVELILEDIKAPECFIIENEIKRNY